VSLARMQSHSLACKDNPTEVSIKFPVVRLARIRQIFTIGFSEFLHVIIHDL